MKVLDIKPEGGVDIALLARSNVGSNASCSQAFINQTDRQNDTITHEIAYRP